MLRGLAEELAAMLTRWQAGGHHPRHHPRPRVVGTVFAVFAGLLVVVLAGCSSAAAVGAGAASPSSSSPPPRPPRITLAPVQARGINPSTPVTVHTENGQLQRVRMSNAHSGVVVSGAFGSGHRSWSSTEDLGYHASYHLTASATGRGGRTVKRAFTVSTLTPQATATARLSPSPSLDSVGVGQPLGVAFSRPITDQAAVIKRLRVTTSPEQAGAWRWINDHEVHYRPKTFWKPGTSIHVTAKIYGTDLGGGVYGAADETASYRVHGSWIAKANGATHQMRIYHDGNHVKTMPISMGKPATPTHRGIHVISAKDRQVEMNSCSFGVCSGPEAYDVIEYWAERISNDGEFVHENPASVGAQGSSNVSHGCINLNETNAEWFYHHLGPGDVVEVSHSDGGRLPVGDRYGDWSLSWAKWQAGAATG